MAESNLLPKELEEQYAAEILRSTPEYGAAWDLELWKMAQREQFNKQMEEERKALQAKWHKEWEEVLTQKESEFVKRREELEQLAGRVRESMEALVQREAAVNVRENDLEKVENELHLIHQAKMKELQYSMQRAVESSTSTVIIERLKLTELEKSNRLLEQRVNTLLEQYSTVCQEFSSYKSQDKSLELQGQRDSLAKQLDLKQSQIDELRSKLADLQTAYDECRNEKEALARTVQQHQVQHRQQAEEQLQEGWAKLEKAKAEWQTQQLLGSQPHPWRWAALPTASDSQPQQPAAAGSALSVPAPSLFNATEVRDFKNAILELLERERALEESRSKVTKSDKHHSNAKSKRNPAMYNSHSHHVPHTTHHRHHHHHHPEVLPQDQWENGDSSGNSEVWPEDPGQLDPGSDTSEEEKLILNMQKAHRPSSPLSKPRPGFNKPRQPDPVPPPDKFVTPQSPEDIPRRAVRPEPRRLHHKLPTQVDVKGGNLSDEFEPDRPSFSRSRRPPSNPHEIIDGDIGGTSPASEDSEEEEAICSRLVEQDVTLQNLLRNRQQLVDTGVYTPEDVMIRDMDERIVHRKQMHLTRAKQQHKNKGRRNNV